LRGFVKFCTRPTTCQKKSNLLICRQVLDLLICRSVDSSEKIDRSTNNMVIWDTKSHLSICRHVDRLLICRSVNRSNRWKKIEKIDIWTDKHQQTVKSWDTLFAHVVTFFYFCETRHPLAVDISDCSFRVWLKNVHQMSLYHPLL
jgi:hypothetical protein